MKQALFILTEEFDYEGGTPIGVYSSEEAARTASAVYRAADGGRGSWSSCRITVLDLNDPATFNGHTINL